MQRITPPSVDRGAVFSLIAVSLLAVLAGGGMLGWGLNVMKLFNGSCGTENYGCIAARAAGIVIAPAGSVMGYLR